MAAVAQIAESLDFLGEAKIMDGQHSFGTWRHRRFDLAEIGNAVFSNIVKADVNSVGLEGLNGGATDVSRKKGFGAFGNFQRSQAVVKGVASPEKGDTTIVSAAGIGL